MGLVIQPEKPLVRKASRGKLVERKRPCWIPRGLRKKALQVFAESREKDLDIKSCAKKVQVEVRNLIKDPNRDRYISEPYKRASRPKNVYLRACRSMGIHSLSKKEISASIRRVLVEAWIVQKELHPKLVSGFETGVRFWAQKRKEMLSSKRKKARYPWTYMGITRWLGKTLPIPLGPFMALKYADLTRILRSSFPSRDKPFIHPVCLSDGQRGWFLPDPYDPC